MLDVIPIEVQRLVPVVISRRWEASHDTCSFQLQLGVEHTSYYLDIAHTFPNNPQIMAQIYEEISVFGQK